MRLSTIPHLVPEDTVDLLFHLEECGIRTDSELVFSATPFDLFKKLPPGTISLQDLTQFIADVSTTPVIRAVDLLDKPVERLASSLPLLQSLSGVTEISGNSGSGKSAIALNCVLQTLFADPRATALWIDCNGDFSIDDVLDTGVEEQILERLQVSTTFEVAEVHDVLDDSPYPYSILVVDCITALLAPLLSGVSSQGHSLMSGLMRRLRSCARQVLVVNSATLMALKSTTTVNPMSNFATTTKKPALGPSFTYLSDATVWISCVDQALDAGEDQSIHVAEIFRSRNGPSHGWCKFRIRGGLVVMDG
ncbi:hypothetical protein C8J56DRAFT_952965 [Mycena floridula]|nr:hypothetical protein C8J56DRAFT_952965 [Mycena floridula]